MTGRYELSQEQWEVIREWVERQRKGTGRPLRDDRELLNGMFWVLCSGASWRDLPERYGPRQTVYDRYRSLRDDGTLDRMLARLQLRLNAEGLVDLDTWYVDSTTIRASRAAAGAKKRGCQALGRSRGGYGTKLHLLCDAKGNPLAACLGPGQQHDSQGFLPLLEAVRAEQPPELDALAAGPDYSSPTVATMLGA